MTGHVVLIGSGELGPSMVPTLRSIAAAKQPSQVVVLDGSYRFQVNADELTARMIDHLHQSVGWRAKVVSSHQADPVRQAVEIASADLVFAGPGSPTYALGRWRHPAITEALVAVVKSGGTLVMASAAAITLGVKTLPVYEIYKAGSDLYWENGLNVLGSLGFEMVVIPHWNNNEGGTYDTSHCFVGSERFETLEAQLDPTTTVLGIDEHTAVTIDMETRSFDIEGVGTATIRLAGQDQTVAGIPIGDTEAVSTTHAILEMEATSAPELVSFILQAKDHPAELGAIAKRIDQIQDELIEDAVSTYVMLLIELREKARTEGRYQAADEIRQQLEARGIEVTDTDDGPTWAVAAGKGSLEPL